jgi:hypothetical protein
VIAVNLDHDDDPSWYNGPPYAVCEHPIDEYVQHVCSLTRHGGNSGSFTDEQVKRFRNSGKDDIVEYVLPTTTEAPESFEASRAKWHAKWAEDAPMREEQDAAEWEALTALRTAKAAIKQQNGRSAAATCGPQFETPRVSPTYIVDAELALAGFSGEKYLRNVPQNPFSSRDHTKGTHLNPIQTAKGNS